MANDGTAAAAGAGQRDHRRPGREDGGGRRRHGQRACRADPDRDHHREGGPSGTLVDHQPQPVHRADRTVRQRLPPCDTVSTTFGIRYFTFDPAEGFSLNGEYLKIHGVDLHATEGAVGSAVRYDAMARQMELMRSMGVNALRTAHNPPAPELIQVCERLGILLMVEAFDCWHTGKLPYDYHLYFDPVGRLRHQGNGARGQELARGGALVDRQRDAGHGHAGGPGHRQPADRRHQVDRHHPARGNGLRPVPQRARHRLAAGPDPGRAGRARRQLQHRHVHGWAAREIPGQVLLLLGNGLGDLQPRGVSGPAAAQHRGELHPGQAGHFLLRQQPRVLDDERGVRAEEGPGPQVLERWLPVVRAGLHRRAHAL